MKLLDKFKHFVPRARLVPTRLLAPSTTNPASNLAPFTDRVPAPAADLGLEVKALLTQNHVLKQRIAQLDLQLLRATQAAELTQAEIQRAAAVKANEIACRMGAAPIRADDHTDEADGGNIVDQYLALNKKDPSEAARFAARHGGSAGLLKIKL